MFKFKTSAKEAIERNGINQTDIATAASYDRHSFNRKLNHGGNLRPVTTNRIAKAFAQQANVSQEAALELLFEKLEGNNA